MVGLLTTLDDISLDAERAAVLMGMLETVQQKKPTLTTLLSTAATESNDIAELIMDATLRLVLAEETALQNVTAQKQ